MISTNDSSESLVAFCDVEAFLRLITMATETIDSQSTLIYRYEAAFVKIIQGAEDPCLVARDAIAGTGK